MSKNFFTSFILWELDYLCKISYCCKKLFKRKRFVFFNNLKIATNFPISVRISNALGGIGNASINQFISSITSKKSEEKAMELQKKLDMIPALDQQNSDSRYFEAKVLSDINKNNYIKSFSWL